jgi:hypothetical protein
MNNRVKLYENDSKWKAHHQRALHNQEHQHIVLMLRGWCAYASRHQARFDSPIGEDCVLGPQWARSRPKRKNRGST